MRKFQNKDEVIKIELKKIDGVELKPPREGYIRFLKKEEIGIVQKLQEKVLSGLKANENFPTDQEDLLRAFDNGFIFGAFDGETQEMVGCNVFASCSKMGGEYNFPKICGYDNEIPNSCTGMDIWVLKKYRNNGLYIYLSQLQYDYWKSAMKMETCWGTISPTNGRSVYLAFMTRYPTFKIVALKKDHYGPGHHRYIFRGNFNVENDKKIGDDRKEILISNIDDQAKACQEGYVGFNFKKKEDGNYICYGKYL